MMYRVCSEFLSSARFAVNQNAPVGWSRDEDLLPQRSHRHAFADHHIIIVELPAQSQVIRIELALPKSISDRENSPLDLKLLLFKIKRAAPSSTHCPLTTFHQA